MGFESVDGTAGALVAAAGGGWLRFPAPQATIAARRVEDAAAAFAEVCRRVEADGLWAVGYVAYEAGPGFDPALTALPPAAAGPPILRFGLGGPPAEVAGPAPPFAAGRSAATAYRLGESRPSVDAARYRAAIDAIHAAIARGDTYQVNHTYRLRAPFEGDPRGLFAHLVAAQGGACGAYLDLGRHAVCCASPELFFDLEGGRVTCRPMKGTARRGRWAQEDAAAARALAASEKERAENLMIVDMVRNDLGRVAEPGTVAVPHLFVVERYPTLWQMTSTVRAETAAPLPDLFAALFPCASITGAPKAATSRIIADLEGEPRGVYTGAVGWIAPGGRARMSVAIRTAVVDRERGEVEYGVGGGIVWDSRADREAAEAAVKSRVLVREAWPELELLETLLWRGELGGYWLLEEHLRRLRGSARYFGFGCDEAAVRGALEAAVAGREEERLRVRSTLARHGVVEVAVAGLDDEQVAVGKDEAEGLPVVRLGLAAAPVSSDDVLLFHKTTWRRTYEAALAEVKGRCGECEEVLLWNERGEVTEAAVWNVVVEVGGELVTPAVGCGLLPGVLRGRLLEEGVVREGVVRVEELASVDGMWLVNSVRGWRRAVVVDG